MKKLYFSIVLIIFSSYCFAQQNNPAFGLSAHKTDTIGTNTTAGGILQNYWKTNYPDDTLNYIKEAFIRWMRYGGKDVEKDCEIDGLLNDSLSNLNITIRDYVRKATIFQDNLMEPMMTLPLKLDPINIPNFATAAHQAALLVQEVNTKLVTQGYAPVLYWIYSNEPTGSPHDYDTSFAAQIIHDYIKTYHDSVIAHWNYSWGNPKFMGPELESFDNYPHPGPGKVNRLIEQLLGKWNQVLNTNTSEFDITPYISVFTYHWYPFADEANTANGTNGIPAPNRSNAVSVLGTGAPNGFGNTMPLQTQFTTLRNWGLPDSIGIAITEANICYFNDVNNIQNNDSITGVGANSFIAGQLISEWMFISMLNNVGFNFWSGIEGASSFGNYKSNIGFLNKDTSKFGGVGGKKPTWYHFQMVARDFPGSIYKGGYNQNGVTPTPNFPNIGIKTWASVEKAGIKIMIQNQNDFAYPFYINFDSTTIASTSSGKIRLQFNLDNDTAISGNINTLYYPQSTDTAYTIGGRETAVLTFDCHGKFQARIKYSEQDALDNKSPHFKQIGNFNVDPQVFSYSQFPVIGGTITQNKAYVNDTVYIDSDIILAGITKLSFDHSVVIVAPDVKIKATPMASIEIKNNTAIFGADGKQWAGIEMIGNYNNGERLHVENSFIFNAKHAIKTEKIPDLKIIGSVIANGETAIELNRSEAFTVSQNLIAGFKTGIKTSNTKAGYVSAIRENRFIEIVTDIEFKDDIHDMLEITCNEFRYKDRAVKSRDSELREQGETTTSAGNKFIYESIGLPNNYIDHTGTATKYYFGPSEANEFNYPNVMNIPKVQAVSDKFCLTAFADNCDPWINTVIEENGKVSRQFSIYPNPNKGTFNLTLNETFKGEIKITIQDILGRTILMQKIKPGSQSITINLGKSAKGIYMITLENNGNQSTEKLIVE